MPIITNDGFQNNSPKAMNLRYLKNGLVPYTSIAEANSLVPQAYRHRGFSVAVDEGNGYLVEYWYKGGINDADLVKKDDSETPQRLVSTGTVTLDLNDRHIRIYAISNVTINLPTAGGRYGKKYRFTRLDDADYTVTIVGNIQERINSSLTLQLPAKWYSYEIEAADVGTTSISSPGWIITSHYEPEVEEVDFTPVLKFNRDKVRYHTLTQDITYSVALTGNKYGRVITDIFEASSEYVVKIPESFETSGNFRQGVRNTISLTIMPATSADKVLATIRSEDDTAQPVASALHIMGDFQQNELVEAMYDFQPTGQEGDSIIRWYRADNASGLNSQIIPNETDAGFIISNTACGKYIRAGVTPVNNQGYVGTETFTSWEGPITGCNTSTTTTMAGSFNPTNVANLAFWLAADSYQGATNAVTQANDKSGNARHFLPENASRRPTIANGLNGIPGFQFNGSQNLRGPALSDTDNYTIFSVGTVGVCRGLDGNGNGWSIINFGSNKANVVMTQSGMIAYNNTYEFNLSTAKLATIVINNSGTNNSSIAVWDGGTLRGTQSINNRTLRSSTVGFAIGQGGDPSGFSVGNLQEAIVYNRVLTTQEINNVNNYLKAKYNIS